MINNVKCSKSLLLMLTYVRVLFINRYHSHKIITISFDHHDHHFVRVCILLDTNNFLIYLEKGQPFPTRPLSSSGSFCDNHDSSSFITLVLFLLPNDCNCFKFLLPSCINVLINRLSLVSVCCLKSCKTCFFSS